MEGFGEAPGTLWVWVPGLPKISICLVVVAGFAGNHHQNKDDSWRACSPPNLPARADCVTRVYKKLHSETMDNGR